MPSSVRCAAVISLFAILVVGGFSATAADAASPDSLAASLTDRGFENVTVDAGPGGVTVWYENRIYRYEMAALGAVAWLSASALDPGTSLEIVPLNRAVPIVAVSAPAGEWVRFLNGDEDAGAFRGALRVSTRGSGGASPPPPGSRRLNPSRLRTDLELRPLFSFELGIADDPFQYSLYAAPEAVMSPATGFLATVQGQIKINDDLDPFARELSPGRNTLSWGGRVPGDWLAAASAGYFSDDRYGAAVETGRLFGDGAVEFRVGGDYSGYLQFSRGITLYSGLNAWSGFAAATYRTPGIDFEATVTGARFLEGKAGGRVDVARRFGETTVGFFAIKTSVRSVAGVTLAVPLPLAKDPRPARVRVATVDYFPFSYRESALRIGLRVPLFDNLDRLRKGLYPTFIRNNLADLRAALDDVRGSER